MIFYYRTQEEEVIKKLKAVLNIGEFDFKPNFGYNPCFTELNIKKNFNKKNFSFKSY